MGNCLVLDKEKRSNQLPTLQISEIPEPNKPMLPEKCEILE
jgi:hypothetical protein